jgi:hypothetical protein
LLSKKKFTAGNSWLFAKGGLGVTQHLADGPRFNCSISVETDTPSAILPANAQASAAFANFIQLGWIAVRMILMAERGEMMPSQTSTMGCPCGERFESHDPAGGYVHRQHIYAARMVSVDARIFQIFHNIRCAYSCSLYGKLNEPAFRKMVLVLPLVSGLAIVITGR